MMHSDLFFFLTQNQWDVTFQPHDTPATPPTCAGMLQYIDPEYDLPNKAEIHLWTHGQDEEDDATVHAMIDAPEDAEEPEDAKEPEDAEEDLEDTRHLYSMVTGGPYD